MRRARLLSVDVYGRQERNRAAQLARDAGRSALRAPFPGGGTLGQLAGRLVEIAAQGLCRQNCCGQHGEDERHWLDPLRERARSGRSPADEALEARRRGGDRGLAVQLRCA